MRGGARGLAEVTVQPATNVVNKATATIVAICVTGLTEGAGGVSASEPKVAQ
jgi:hypothetical protein